MEIAHIHNQINVVANIYVHTRIHGGYQAVLASTDIQMQFMTQQFDQFSRTFDRRGNDAWRVD